jgi:hypothetical protein
MFQQLCITQPGWGRAPMPGRRPRLRRHGAVQVRACGTAAGVHAVAGAGARGSRGRRRQPRRIQVRLLGPTATLHAAAASVNPARPPGAPSLLSHDLVDGDGDAGDCDGHGTHTASTAAGRSVGVARAASLRAVRVGRRSGQPQTQPHSHCMQQSSAVPRLLCRQRHVSLVRRCWTAAAVARCRTRWRGWRPWRRRRCGRPWP